MCLEQLYDEVSGLLNETYQKLIAPPEEAPSVSNHLKSFYEHVIFLGILRPHQRNYENQKVESDFVYSQCNQLYQLLLVAVSASELT